MLVFDGVIFSVVRTARSSLALTSVNLLPRPQSGGARAHDLAHDAHCLLGEASLYLPIGIWYYVSDI